VLRELPNPGGLRIMKQVAVLIVLGVLGLALVLLLRTPGPGVPAQAPPEATVVSEHVPATAKDHASGSSIDTDAETGLRQAAAGDPSTASTESAFTLHVIDGRTEQPIADAEVRWVAQQDGQPKDRAWREDSHDLLFSLQIDFDQLDAKLGATPAVARSDAEGKLRLPTQWAWLIGRRDNLVGGNESLTRDADESTLRLWPDDDLRVKVADSAGRAMADVDVLLVSSMSQGGEDWDDVVSSRRTDAQGMASFRHAYAAMAAKMKQSPEPPLSFRVEAALIPARSSSAPIDPQQVARDPIVLTLPDGGEVEFTLKEFDGTPIAEDLEVALTEVDEKNTPEDLSQAWLERGDYWTRPGRMNAKTRGGTVIFSNVGLDRRLILFAARNPASRIHAQRIDGPTRAGKRVSVAMLLGSDSVILRGRAIDANGLPLASVRLHTNLFSAPSPDRVEFANRSADDILDCHGHVLTTSAEGRFTIEYAIDAAYGGHALLVLAVPRAGEPTLEKQLDLQDTWRVGMQDLGDVQLDQPPLLAGGVVVNEEGTPVAGAEVRVSVFKGAARIRGLTDERGAFQLRSSLPHSSVSLHVDKDGQASTSTEGGSPGRSDWRIVLKNSGTLRVRVRLPQGASRRDFYVSGRQTDHAGSDIPPNLTGGLDEQGCFDWEECPPGIFRLSVGFKGIYDEPLACVEDLVVRAGETTDAGLVDLSDPSKVTALSIVGPDGTVFDGGAYAAGPDGSKLVAELWSKAMPDKVEAGRLWLAREGERLDVAIAAAGLRTQVFADVHDGDVLRLQHGIPIAVSITNTIGRPPEGVRLLLALVRADLDRRSLLFTGLSWYRGEFDERGEATLFAPEPGRYQLRWMLERSVQGGTKGRSWQDPPQHIEIADSAEPQRFELHCPIDPASAWDDE